MCGIYGYIGSAKTKRKNATDICLEGLQRLEYRGYDSAGIAGLLEGKIKACKRAGKLQSLLHAVRLQKLDLDIAIAHTRWATHGTPTALNAHPHCDQHKTLAIVHNGIIENYLAIRSRLIDCGVTFQSDTDSEVIAQLIAHYYHGDFKESVQKAIGDLQGSFAIAVIHKNHPDTIIASARESPLVVALCRKNQHSYLSSDPNSFTDHHLQITYLQNDEIAVIHPTKIDIFHRENKKQKGRKWERLGRYDPTISKNGYEHYMLKEIYEQPQTIQQAIVERMHDEFGTADFEGMTIPPKELQSTKRILILACGTSFHAGCIAASMFENIARIPTETEIASEFRYTNPLISEDTLVIAISQSGETADTIAAVREAKAKGAKVLVICNVPRSTLTREADHTIFLRAGPEISVCSTKAFTSQLSVLSLFTLYMARLRHLGKVEGQRLIQEIKSLPIKVEQVLAQEAAIQKFAKEYVRFKQFIFIGRRYMYPTSLEAALKLKEITYLYAAGYPAGELKHGPLALISPKVAVVAMCGNHQTLDKMLSNLMEIRARGGNILAFAPKGEQKVLNATPNTLFLPETIDELASVPYSVAGQLFAYHIAKLRGREIDKPRNLAKSVTVE